MPDDSVPPTQSDSGNPPLTGSRRRGPDERAVGEPEGRPKELRPSDEIFARQIDLAYERETIRLRRHRLQHPAPLAPEPRK